MDRKKTLNCRGKLVDLSGGVVMGILNATPDSFYDGGKYSGLDAQLAQAEKMLKQGAAIIDVGGFSTRPGAGEISVDEELSRVIPVIESLHKSFPEVIISIDTFRSTVAKHAVEAGACMVNDISAGDEDPQMAAAVVALRVPYIIMHKKGTPKDMQVDPQYEDVAKEVFQYLSFKCEKLTLDGVADIIVDPGFGFGKTLEHNFELLRKLHIFSMLNKPVLVGLSRKSMINKILKTKPENALNGTTVLNTLALLQGCDILRVHDVKEAVETLKLVNYYRETV